MASRSSGRGPHAHTFFQIRRCIAVPDTVNICFSAPPKGERGTVPGAFERERADILRQIFPEQRVKAPRRTCPYPPGRSTHLHFSRDAGIRAGRCPRSRQADPARESSVSSLPCTVWAVFPASASRGSACRRSKASVCNFASGNSLLFLTVLSIAHLNTSSIYFSIFSVFLLNLPIRSNLFTFSPEFVHGMFTL